MRHVSPQFNWLRQRRSRLVVQRGSFARRNRSAFTILELVVVVLIMGILAAAAVPAFLDSLLFYRVESGARRVKADLELARQTARLTSAAQSLTFTGFSYALGAATPGLDNPNDIYQVDLAAEPYELDTVTVDFGGTQSVSFDGYGKPSAGGTVILRSKDSQCTVTLEATTGEVTIASNDNRGRTAKVSTSSAVVETP